MRIDELRHRVPPILQALQERTVYGRTPVTGLRKKRCPYHSWDTLREDSASPGWEPFAPGDAIGGEETHFCFQGGITAPAGAEGKHLVCLVSTGADDIWNNNNPQFLAYLNGELLCGLDVNHTEFDLSPAAQAGQQWQLGLYAYTNAPAQDVFLQVETAVRDDEVTALYYDLKVPYGVLEQLAPDSADALCIGRHLEGALALLDLRRPGSASFYKSVAAARKYLKEQFYEGCCRPAPVTEACVGHTHIDVAWLWTLAQTREKAIRSFATVNYLMDRYPEYRFLASQPQLYDFVRRDFPSLYGRIQNRVAQGRWEPEGGMWLESDCNMTSGESLVRQFLHGEDFFRREFGRECRLLWLPDAFGFSGALPQIMKQCGMRWFMTTKLAWNDTNCVPHDLMRWRGIDGTEVLAYFISTKDHVARPDKDPRPSFNTTYNGLLNPRQVMGCWQRFQDKELSSDVLQCFGYGDGGGGVTAEMLEMNRRLEKGIPGAPQTRISFAGEFFDQLEQSLQDKELPVWSGEYYFEYHRGVFTSQGRIKRANRQAEFANLTAETMASLALACTGEAYPADALHRNWELTLLNQFHDILPGSALGEVYRDAEAQYQEILASDGAVIDSAAHAIAARLHTDAPGVVVFNQLGFARDSVVSLPWPSPAAVYDGDTLLPCHWENGTLSFAAAALPAKGWKWFRVGSAVQTLPAAVVDGDTIETPFYRLKLTRRGTIASLFDKEAGRELLQPGREGNEFQLFDDHPEEYDAWNLDKGYKARRYPLEEPARISVVESSPLRCRIHIRRTLSLSTLDQEMVLYAKDRRIDFVTRIDWHDRHVLLKTAFPLDIHCERAQYDIQFGSIGRDTHHNTSWDSARFEVCAHKWADLSEPGYGAALLNDGRYGYDAEDGVLRLSLLRGSTYPDPEADQGVHCFTYSLLPHQGDWRTGGVIPAAYDLNAPAPALPLDAQPDGTLPAACGLFSVSAPNVVLETVKQAEDGNGFILRLFESWGMRTQACLTLPEGWTAHPVTPMEQPLQEDAAAGEFRPFALRSFRVLPKLG